MANYIAFHSPTSPPGSFEPLFTAKHQSDTWLAEQSKLDWTILRPGMLTEAPATGKVQLAKKLHITGTISREDVAAAALALVQEDKAIGLSIDVQGPEEGKVSVGVVEAVQKAMAPRT